MGLAEDYSEIIWNENYRVPSPVNDDVCDYPLARNLVLMTTAVATEVIIEFISTTKKLDFTFTLRDLTIKAIL